MQINTVIFDMDGLLIDSEPLWGEAADEVFRLYGIRLTKEQYTSTTGLRTREFVQWWFHHFKVSEEKLFEAENRIIDCVMDKISQKATLMPGVHYIFDFFRKRNFKIGLASSSPQRLIDLAVGQFELGDYLQVTASAESLPFGKPHPQVYLDCAAALHSHPGACICFEDSFNGMIAAKAARMKCVVVPHHSQQKEERWGAADLKLTSLQNFGELHLNLIG
ncbi:hexitol phosphatase HxpB [Deminuibacter soli]|nr:hexitol phosphatase HxpB [Deminuibacter soli]